MYGDLKLDLEDITSENNYEEIDDIMFSDEDLDPFEEFSLLDI